MKHPPLNICFLINQLAPGGAPTLLLDIVRRSDPTKVEYTVCYIEGEDTLATDFEAAGARVVDFGAEFKFDPRAIARLARFFRREQFDVLHTHLPYAQTLGRIFGTIGDTQHVVSTQHSAPNNYHPVTRILERNTRSLDSRTIAVSKAIERLFTGDAREYESGQSKQWCTIHNGIDVEKFSTEVRTADTSDFPSEWVSGDGPLFLNVGRYFPQKAQHTLIEAMGYVVRKLPDAKLLIVGWGELENELRATTRKYGLDDTVVITGRVPSIQPYYRIADGFVLSSVRESFGIVLLEAMAAKLPVIATEVQGIPEIVRQKETGILVPPRSPKQLANAMIQLDDAEWRECLGNSGYDRVRHKFNIDKTTAQHINLYQELCLSRQ